MTPSLALQLFLRLLPSILFFAAAFLANRDENVKQMWADLLVKAGSIRLDQSDDPKIRAGAKVPLLVVGGLLLIWPILYMWKDSYAQLPLTVLAQPTARPKPTPVPKVGAPTPTPTATIVPGLPSALPQALPETSPPPADVVPTFAPSRGFPDANPGSGAGSNGGPVPLNQAPKPSGEPRKPVPLRQ